MAETEKPLTTTVQIDAYQLNRDEVDVPAMVGRAQSRLRTLKRKALAAILDSSIWSQDYPSVQSFDIRRYEGYSNSGFSPCKHIYPLEANTGAINVPSRYLDNSDLGSYFNPLRKRQQGQFTELRGLSYYTALDFSKTTPAEKLTVMTGDIKEGLYMLDGVDRRNLDVVDYPLYLGILDHIKFQSLTAFHALTYHERKGEILDDKDYIDIRNLAQKTMMIVTRAYYQACLGRSFDSKFNLSEIAKVTNDVADYIAKSGHTIVHFTFPEVINPLVIILGAHEAARRKPYPNTIIGIPSGGTEVAVVTALMYESLYPELTPPEAAFVPLSFHYHGQGGLSSDQLIGLLTQSGNVAGQRVLIVDDNSNTGSTLQGMSEAVMRAGAGQRFVHIAEIDPARVKVKNQEGKLPFGVVNMDHPDLETAMGMTGISDQDGADLRRRGVRRLVKNTHKEQKRLGASMQEQKPFSFRL